MLSNLCQHLFLVNIHDTSIKDNDQTVFILFYPLIIILCLNFFLQNLKTMDGLVG